MAVVDKLIQGEADGSLSFGNHTLPQKAKLEDFEHAGDVYKVKTFQTMTKLEKNGMFLYESVPGTSVNNFKEESHMTTFKVEGAEDAQLTLGLKEDTQYEVFVGEQAVGRMGTGLSGKLNISVELADMGEVTVKVVEA